MFNGYKRPVRRFGNNLGIIIRDYNRIFGFGPGNGGIPCNGLIVDQFFSPTGQRSVISRGVAGRSTLEVMLPFIGIAYIGVYGGDQFEGIWEADHQRPKRFFSFFSDAQIENEVSNIFNIHSFECINVDSDGDLHYQSIILRKRISNFSNR